MILKLFRPSSPARNIRDLYGAIVAQARAAGLLQPVYGVPDTVQGRFDLIVLHLVLVLAQIGRQAGEQALPQACRTWAPRGPSGNSCSTTFCRDLDDNLREMGVGDLAVPKKMRGFAEAFYGRQAAYVAALAATDRRELENALARNIFDECKSRRGSGAACRLCPRGVGAVRATRSKRLRSCTIARASRVPEAGDYADCRGRPKWVSKSRET